MRVSVSSAFLKGVVKAPPSKSLAHRALICAALARGKKTIIDNIELSNDIRATLSCLCSIGVKYNYNEYKLTVYSPEKYNEKAELFCMESGSTLRFLMPVMSALGIECKIDGSGRLSERPYKMLADEMEKHGAKFSTKKGLPVNIDGKLRPGIYTLKGDESSQYISGLLFALPLLKGDSKIKVIGKTESERYIDLTIQMLEHFSVIIEKEADGYYIKGNQHYISKNYENEGDYSQAAFFMCAGVLNGDIEITKLKKDSLQADIRIVDILKKMNGEITFTDCGVKVQKSNLVPIKYDFSQCPDIAPVVAATLACVKGRSTLTGLKRLKLKESDRLTATCNMINTMGAVARISGEDTLIIDGNVNIKNGVVCGFNDHRIVMSAATAGVTADEIIITDAEAVNKSYGGFFDDYSGLGGNVNVLDVG